MLVKHILDFIFPNHCLLCGTIIQNKNTICTECINNLAFRHKDKYIFCKTCGNVLEDINSICNCKKEHNYYFNEMRAVFYYDDSIKYIIHQMKFYNRYRICFDFAIIASFYYQDFIKANDIIIAVALSTKRKKERGYNQSAIIAKNIALKLNIPFNDKLVKRHKNTKPLSKAGGIEERKMITENAFSIEHDCISMFVGKNVLLVDDIFTTGSTVNEISKIIKENVGVLNIDVFCIARA